MWCARSSAELIARVEAAAAAGIAPSRVVLDPGIGFGKRGAQNWEVLRATPAARRRSGHGCWWARAASGSSRGARPEPDGEPATEARRDLPTAVISVAGRAGRSLGVSRARRGRARATALRVLAAWDGADMDARDEITLTGLRASASTASSTTNARGQEFVVDVTVNARHAPGRRIRRRRRHRALRRAGRGDRRRIVERRPGRPDRDGRRADRRTRCSRCPACARSTVTVHKPSAPDHGAVRRRDASRSAARRRPMNRRLAQGFAGDVAADGREPSSPSSPSGRTSATARRRSRPRDRARAHCRWSTDVRAVRPHRDRGGQAERRRMPRPPPTSTRWRS